MRACTHMTGIVSRQGSWAARVVRTCLALTLLALTGCDFGGASAQPENGPTVATAPSESPTEPRVSPVDEEPRGTVTLGFAGDVHFESHLRGLLRRPGAAFGSMRPVMRQTDLMMVNLESAITRRGTAEPKLYRFRVAAEALDLLDGAGVDVVTVANNHAADYGAVGLRDTLAAVRRSPVPVLGVGRDADAAFRPFRTTVRGTDLAVHVASTKIDRTANHWAADEGVPGVAVARQPRGRLLREVRRSQSRSDVLVVYLHWGFEGTACPTHTQVEFAEALSDAGADIVVGSHAHVLLGSGWLRGTYVNYGLGNFLWYNQGAPSTGILKVRIEDGEVVGDSWVPGRHTTFGPELLPRRAREGAVASWRALRGCTGLAAEPR